MSTQLQGTLFMKKLKNQMPEKINKQKETGKKLPNVYREYMNALRNAHYELTPFKMIAHDL